MRLMSTFYLQIVKMLRDNHCRKQKKTVIGNEFDDESEKSDEDKKDEDSATLRTFTTLRKKSRDDLTYLA